MCQLFRIVVFLAVWHLTHFAYAEDPKASDQRGAAEVPEARTAAPKPTGFAVPLTIDQIRSLLPATSAAERFEFLRNQRKTTLDAMSSVSTQLATVEAKLKLTQSNRAEMDTSRLLKPQSYGLPISKERLSDRIKSQAEELKVATKKYEDARARNVPKQELDAMRDMVGKMQFVLTDLQDTVNVVEQNEKREVERQAKLKAADEEMRKLTEQRDELSSQQLSYQRLLGSIDDMVNQLFIASDATNSFKLRMSIAFSILVGVVIVGFFAIAWSNDEIKKTIFAHEAGVQFITIFSIVIAVILFGIIGVLESKELSALLGGLSGYILGKSRATTS